MLRHRVSEKLRINLGNMANSTAAWPLPKTAPTTLNTQLDLLAGSTDLAVRSTERWWQTQLDGCRDWMDTLVTHPQSPCSQVEQHIDQSLHLGWGLFVAQVAAITESMQLIERAMAENQRALLSRLVEVNAPAPVRSAICLSGTAYESLSKASRQVANFASNRMSAATVSAFQQACDKMSESTSTSA